MLTPEKQANLNAAAAAAVRSEAHTAMPAIVTLAQWVEESGWGIHAPGNNCFGIKSYPGCWGKQSLLTCEGDDPELVEREFATFPDLEACFRYHDRLITTGLRYAPAWTQYRETRNGQVLIVDLAGIYAPGNSVYATHVLGFFHDPRLLKAIETVRAALFPPVPTKPPESA